VSISWEPSGLVIWKLKGPEAPAWVLEAPAFQPMSKGRSWGVLAQGPPLGPWLMSKPLEDSVGGPDSGADHGVLVAVVTKLPQVVGLASAERLPPLRLRSRRVNGSWGRLSKVTLICPVCWSGSTLPGSLMKIPFLGFSITR